MATPDFTAIFNELRSSVADLAKTTVAGYVSQATAAGQGLLDTMKDQLQEWVLLLANNSLTPEDFSLLVLGQKDLIVMNGLEQAGLAAIQAEAFKNAVVHTIIGSVFSLVKV